MGIKEKVKKAWMKVSKEAKVLKGEEGKDSIYYSRKRLLTNETAKYEFKLAVRRLFDVNKWSDIPAIVTAKFQVYDHNLNPATELQEGYFIKIQFPGPTPENWVKVMEIYKEENVAELVLSPSYDPTNSHKEVTEHFFTREAASSFRVTLKGKLLSAYEIGRGEVINKNDQEAGDRAILNTIIAETGWLGFQKHQWQNLTDYLIGLK